MVSSITYLMFEPYEFITKSNIICLINVNIDVLIFIINEFLTVDVLLISFIIKYFTLYFIQIY